MAISVISVHHIRQRRVRRQQLDELSCLALSLSPSLTPSTVTPLTTHVDTTLTPTEIPTISPIVPPSPDYTPASLDYPPASDTEFNPSEDPSSDHIPPLPATSPFLSSTDDSSDSDTPDTPPSPTHDLFTSDDSSETSSDSSSDDLSDYSSVITERPSHSSFMGPSHKRSRSPTTSVLISSPIPGALSPAHADLLPPPKRIRSSDSATDLEDCSDKSSELSVTKGTSLRDDIIVRGSDEPYSEPDIDPEIQAEIDECITYADALIAEGIDARVVVETVAREEVETRVRGPVEVRVEMVTHLAVPDDIPEPAQEEGAIKGTYETLGDLGHRIVATGQQSVVLSERISEIERDNTRLRGTLGVVSQRVTRTQRRELRVCREMRQIRRFRFYDRIRISRLEACARKHLGYHP
ncbi:hypothetical protein Tco_0804726 [Tanacetum coccineum]|uniref:Uncharacterized protein n=1 Tax=Tanacetum coccineum TaxID=301880 RepID=A0ABQ5A9P1_9ASTR